MVAVPHTQTHVNPILLPNIIRAEIAVLCEPRERKNTRRTHVVVACTSSTGRILSAPQISQNAGNGVIKISVLDQEGRTTVSITRHQLSYSDSWAPFRHSEVLHYGSISGISQQLLDRYHEAIQIAVWHAISGDITPDAAVN